MPSDQDFQQKLLDGYTAFHIDVPEKERNLIIARFKTLSMVMGLPDSANLWNAMLAWQLLSTLESRENNNEIFKLKKAFDALQQNVLNTSNRLAIDFRQSEESVRSAIGLYRSQIQAVERETEIALQKHSAEAENTFKTSMGSLMNKLMGDISDKMLEKFDELASSFSHRQTAIIIAMLFAVCLMGIGAWSALAIHIGRSWERSEMTNRELVLKEQDNFLASALGKQTLVLRKEGKLQEIIDFGTSDIGEIAREYSKTTLSNILGCQQTGWRVEEDASTGRRVCIPGKTGFYIPDRIILPKTEEEKNTGDNIREFFGVKDKIRVQKNQKR